MVSPVSLGIVIVAHPDDEVLWCGGFILSHLHWQWHIVTLCRASDPDRSPRFRASLDRLHASGSMADLDDGPEQHPLRARTVDRTITELLRGSRHASVILTHGPHGEYTRHRRHEECHRAVKRLWLRGVLRAPELWFFAYGDADRTRCPEADPAATHRFRLAEETLATKKSLITETYGFRPESWEATCMPSEEAFIVQERI